MKKLLVFTLLLLISSLTYSATYTWNVNGSGDYAVAGNWTSSRDVPAADDILIIDGIATTGPVTLTNVQTETIGELHVINSVYATISALTAAKTITIAGGASLRDLEVGVGSTLKFYGDIGITMDLSATATGVIEGDVIWNATVLNILHRIRSGAVDGLVFESGATAAMAPVSTGAANGYGGTAGTANGVRFKSGATHYQGGLKDGTRNGGTGTNPQGLSQPASLVVFDSGSTYVLWDGFPSQSGRTFGNFIWRGSVSQASTGGSGLMVVQNDFRFAPSLVGTAGTLTSNGQTGGIRIDGNFIIESGATSGGFVDGTLASAANFEIKGNVDIQDPAKFTPSATTNRTYLLSGASIQSVNFAGKILPNLTINNSAGVTLTGNVAITNQLNLQAGEVATGANSITASDGALGVVRTSGFVNGTLTRAYSGATTGSRIFPIGTAGKYAPVDFNITIAGLGVGTLAISTTDGDHASIPVPGDAVNRYWTLNASGISGFTADITFTYLDPGDIGGADENTFIGARFVNPGWEYYSDAGSERDTVANTVKVKNVTTLSDWTLYEQATKIQDWSNY